jgi:serine O-acetyltransferase
MALRRTDLIEEFTMPAESIAQLVAQVLNATMAEAQRLPSKCEARQFAQDLFHALFPAVCNPDLAQAQRLESEFKRLHIALENLLRPTHNGDAQALAREFFAALPAIHRLQVADANALYETDPAARSVAEVIQSYPGFYAIAQYRLAHQLYLQNAPFLPRLITEYAHEVTGIDIHPGARIGARVAIDHGSGVVIGETSVVGERVRIYQGVTLGALAVEKTMQNAKRHPTVEDDVVIYANATILGGETVIGRGSTIGANAWITKSVPPETRVAGNVV